MSNLFLCYNPAILTYSYLRKIHPSPGPMLSSVAITLSSWQPPIYEVAVLSFLKLFNTQGDNLETLPLLMTHLYFLSNVLDNIQ